MIETLTIRGRRFKIIKLTRESAIRIYRIRQAVFTFLYQHKIVRGGWIESRLGIMTEKSYPYYRPNTGETYTEHCERYKK